MDAQETVLRRALLCIVAAAVIARAALMLLTEFPINDGGLFYAAVLQSAKDWPNLPTKIDYNGYSIPFAYPPLSFFLGALLVRFRVDAVDIVHHVPILMNIAYTVLCVILLRVARVPMAVVLFAAAFFVFLPQSYQWLVMGGGLSRGLGSIGYIGALIALQTGARADHRPSVAWAIHIGAGVAVGIAVLSHLEWGVLAAASTLISLALTAASLRIFLIRSVVVGTVAVVVALPWFTSVYLAHGLQPFWNASQTSSVGQIDQLQSLIDSLIRPGYLAPLILVGIVGSWRRGDKLWVALSLAALIFTPRHAQTPVAFFKSVLAGYGVVAVLAWVHTALGRFGNGRALRVWRLLTPGSLAASALVGIVALSAIQAARHVSRDGLAVLSPAHREAMAWIAREAPGSRFVVRNSDFWFEDQVSEWLPILSNAVSLSTVQGTEWLPSGRFRQLVENELAFEAATHCALIIEKIGSFGNPTHIWVEPKHLDRIETRPDCFERNPAFIEVYRNAEVIIFQKSPRS